MCIRRNPPLPREIRAIETVELACDPVQPPVITDKSRSTGFTDQGRITMTEFTRRHLMVTAAGVGLASQLSAPAIAQAFRPARSHWWFPGALAAARTPPLASSAR